MIEKQNINLLVNTLIKTGGGENPYGKFSEILKAFAADENIRVLRNTILFWFDTMNLFEVDFKFQPPKYRIIKPFWAPGAVANQYNLIGALTLSDTENLASHVNVGKRDNVIRFDNYEVHLPDSHYTDNIESVEDLGFETIKYPLFTSIDSDVNIESIEDSLIKGKLVQREIEEIKRISFVKDTQETNAFIEKQDFIQIFDWRYRKFSKCSFKEEMQDEEGIKLVRIEKKYSDIHREIFTLLLFKEYEEDDWNYWYFDNKSVDERWARYIFLSKLTHYDLHRGIDGPRLAMLRNNLKINSIDFKKFVEQDLDSKNVVKIDEVMLKQFIQYDKRKGVFAVPVSIPLPRLFMKYLYSCSGAVPQVYANNFSRNPNYILKLLFSGKISENGQDIEYPDENYFMKEDMYLFTCIPVELAEAIVLKLNMAYYKRTFFESVK